MTSPALNSDMSNLARECEVFCRYLTGHSASKFTQEKFSEAHQRDSRYHEESSFDHILLSVARLGTLAAQCMDSYACIAARSSLLRKKLVLLMAILESSDPKHGFDDQISDTPTASIILKMAGRGILFGLRLVPTALILIPIQFVMSISKGWGASR